MRADQLRVAGLPPDRPPDARGGAGLPLVDTALVGSLVLLVADLAAQYALPVPVPAGVVTIVFGGGYLLWMLIARNA